jgi:hypothetical protein
MQDRYAGDVGDFIKLGLLRHLAHDPHSSFSLGLNWYRVPDESHNADGKHVAYLDPTSVRNRGLRACDPDLIVRLTKVVHGRRLVEALERCGALPPATRTHEELLDPALGHAGRRAWHRRALTALAGTDIVLVDPDNGIKSATTGSKLHKYALLGELADYARRGQALIAYHHADRSAAAEAQARRRVRELADAVRQTPVGAMIARRGSCRFFLATAADATRRLELVTSLVDFAADWAPHVEFVPPTPL